MRELILKSAHELFVDRGFEEISIRNIADAIEYSPATIYLYFKDKNEIFYALHGEAFQQFNAFMAPLATIKDPFERLVTMGELYIRFAFINPKYYDIMFILDSPMQCDKTSDDWKEGERALQTLEGLVTECMAQGFFKNQDVKIMAFTIWSYVHGMCSLSLRERMRHYPEEEHEEMKEKSFRIFVQMLSKL